MWDIGIFSWMNGSWGAGWDEFWWVVTGKITWAPLYAALVWLLWRRFGWRGMLLGVGMMGVAVGVADLVAGYFKSVAFCAPRLRPSHTEGLGAYIVHGYHGGRFGTVSAHAATTAAIATIACGLLRRRWLSAVMWVWVAMVCYSRIYVSAHFPQDILLGLALGATLGILMLLARRAIQK